MTIDNKYHLGQLLYLLTDPHNQRVQVVGIIVSFGGQIRYQISSNGSETEVYEEELTPEKTFHLN